MGKFVDGFVIPILTANIEKYREMAQKAGEIWKEHGALDYYEAVGDDLEIENVVSFKQIAGAKEEETVIFAWIVYESREERDRINALVMEDARMKDSMCSGDDPPFDYKRMAYGGFKTIVEF
jgi:uncharacterized protein YbaA (DUF1428 family)